MENLSGCLMARLAEKDEQYESHLIDEINRQIKPPRPVAAKDIHIRAMYIVSDQVNSQGGCFAEEEFDRLTRLLVDSPVMVGHRRDSLPLARNFMAQRVEIDGRAWIKSYFYWMRDSEGAEDLKNNIDGGIYKECSVSFLFTLPECSICGKDIRECRHIPFHEYDMESGERQIAHFKYRNIEKVLETSLVFRGAVPDTHITDELSSIDDTSHNSPIQAVHFSKISELSTDIPELFTYRQAPLLFYAAADFTPNSSITALHLAPYQPGIMLRIIRNDDKIELESGRLLPEKVRQYLADIFSGVETGSFDIDVILYAVKGKERLNGLGLMQLLESEENLHRLRLKVCDAVQIGGCRCHDKSLKERMEQLGMIFGDVDRRDIELRKFHTVARPDWKDEIAVGEATCYNFGLEVISECPDGSLNRHILTGKQLFPARVTKTSRANQVHIKCDLKLIGRKTVATGVDCSRAVGVEKGSIALLDRHPEIGHKRRKRWVLTDILPGSDSINITTPEATHDTENRHLYVDLNESRLRLFIEEENHWLAVTIYHFSPRLFARGRRFIADIAPEKAYFIDQPSGQPISARSINFAGKLIHIRPAETSSLFSDKSDLWLRPVLIDGVERYLFYGGASADFKEGL